LSVIFLVPGRVVTLRLVFFLLVFFIAITILTKNLGLDLSILFFICLKLRISLEDV